jgi:hypothetical protein
LKLSRLTRFAAAATIGVAALATGVVAFSPSAFAASPTAVPNPNPTAGLHDLQTINVSGSGWDNNTSMQLIECSGTVASPPTDSTSCDGNTLGNITTGSSGSFSGNYKVYTTGVAGSHFPNDQPICSSTSSCVIAVTENISNFAASPGTVFIALNFAAPPVPAVAPTYPTSDSANVVAGSSVNVNVLAGATAVDSNGSPETINAVPSTPTVAPTHGSVTETATNGVFTYTETDATLNSTGGSDTFTIGGPTATLASDSPSTSPAGSSIVVTITIAKKPTGETTTLIQAANPGDTTIYVANKQGMTPKSSSYVGDSLQIAAPGGTPTQTVTYVSDPPGSIVVTPALTSAFPEGSTVTDLDTIACTAPCSVASGNALSQIVEIPLVGGSLTMSESSPDGVNPPTDALTSVTNEITGSGERCAAPSGGKLPLTGEPFFACGALSPITVINARGTSALWTVTGVLEGDFLDTNAAAGTTCDVIAKYNRDCIPAGNMQWGPVAAVSGDVVPGDVANITAGQALSNVPYLAAASCGTPAIAGTCQPGSVAASALTGTPPTPAAAASGGWTSAGTVASYNLLPAAGLSTAQTLCVTAAGTSGGTFACGANLEVAVPQSAAANDGPYTATLLLTLA